MFDISFTELLIIGIVALVVIGPEKLPKVARTVGHLLGRAQRYVNDVKRDIKQEMDGVDSLKDLKKEMEDAARSVKDSVDNTTRALRNPLEEAQEAMRKAEASVNSTIAGLPGNTTPAESGDAATDAPAAQPEQQALPDTGSQAATPEQPAAPAPATPTQPAPADKPETTSTEAKP